jgi:hypothetical protein
VGKVVPVQLDAGPKYTDRLMFCTACKEDGAMEKDSVFVKGSAVMRQDGIKYHDVSDRHKWRLKRDFNSAAK